MKCRSNSPFSGLIYYEPRCRFFVSRSPDCCVSISCTKVLRLVRRLFPDPKYSRVPQPSAAPAPTRSGQAASCQKAISIVSAYLPERSRGIGEPTEGSDLVGETVCPQTARAPRLATETPLILTVSC